MKRRKFIALVGLIFAIPWFLSVSAFATESYVTDTSGSSYYVEDNGTVTSATNNQTKAIRCFITDAESSDSVNVSWYAQGDNIADGYELYYSTDETFEEERIIEIDDADTDSIRLNNLEDNGIYYLRMRAYVINDEGEKEYSIYNNYVRVNLETGELYRENAPDPQDVGEEEYRQFIYEDICYEHEEPDDDIE